MQAAVLTRFLRELWRRLWQPLYRNAVLLMLNTVLTLALGLVFWILVARIYPSTDVGLSAAAIGAVVFLGGLANLGFNVGLVRYLPEAADRSRAMVNTCLTIGTLAGALAGLLFLVGIDVWAPPLFFLRKDMPLALTVIATCAVVAMVPVIDAVLVARRSAHLILAKQGVMGLRVPLPLLLAPFFGVFGILGSWAIAMVVSALVALFLFLPRVVASYRPFPMVQRDVVRDLFRFSFGNYVAGVIAAATPGLLPLLIVNVHGAVSGAHFYVTFSIASLLYIVPTAAATSLYAEGSQPGADFARDTRETVWLMVLLLVPGILFFYFAGDFVLGLYGSEYAAAGFELLRLLALSAAFVAVTSLYVTKLRVEKRVRPIILLSAATAGSVLALSAATLPAWGISAVGYAELAAQGSAAGFVGLVWLRERLGTAPGPPA